MVPKIGRIVHYKLSALCAETVNRAETVNLRAKDNLICNRVNAGEVYPAMIVRTWGNDESSAVQLQVFIDGNFTLWATSVTEGDGERQFQWPIHA